MLKLIYSAPLLLSAAVALAIPVGRANDIDDLIAKSPDIFLARVLAAPDSPPGIDQPWEVEVLVLKVLKGNLKPGTTKHKTFQTLQPGETYLLFGPHWGMFPSNFPANPDMNYRRLDGKPLRDQVILVLEERKSFIEKRVQELREEQRGLDEITRTGKFAR